VYHIVVTFGIGAICKKLSGKYEFCENRATDSQTLLKELN